MSIEIEKNYKFLFWYLCSMHYSIVHNMLVNWKLGTTLTLPNVCDALKQMPCTTSYSKEIILVYKINDLFNFYRV